MDVYQLVGHVEALKVIIEVIEVIEIEFSSYSTDALYPIGTIALITIHLALI